ncbi:MAG: hypothetical protein HY823_08825 [Acidobacteria bacterium]|nr:hypothetical protein [Acidobacteriota bacterium]
MRHLLPLVTRVMVGTGFLATPLFGEAPWSFAMNLHGGPTLAGLKTVSQDAGYTFGLSLEGGKRLANGASLVTSVGYQWIPGDNRLVSKYAASVPATGINPSIYDMRMRKTNGGGFQAAVLYRANLAFDGFFVQGGLQFGSIKMNERDGGTRVTTNGTAISNMYNPSSPGILSITTIQDDHDATAFTVGPKLGAGYMVNDFAALTLNATMFRAKSHSSNPVNGWAAELGLNIRF